VQRNRDHDRRVLFDDGPEEWCPQRRDIAGDVRTVRELQAPDRRRELPPEPPRRQDLLER
jgi:hypothetical protein